jgi:hypothetical protein
MSVNEDKRLIRELRAPVEPWPPQQPERFRRLEPEVLPPPPPGSPEDFAGDDIDFYEADRRGRRLWLWVIGAGALLTTCAVVAVLVFRLPVAPFPTPPAPEPVAPTALPSAPEVTPPPAAADRAVTPAALPDAAAPPVETPAARPVEQPGADELPPPRRVRSIPIVVPPATAP